MSEHSHTSGGGGPRHRTVEIGLASATTLFGLKPAEISYVAASAKMGLGTMDLQSIKIVELSI